MKRSPGTGTNIFGVVLGDAEHLVKRHLGGVWGFGEGRAGERPSLLSARVPVVVGNGINLEHVNGAANAVRGQTRLLAPTQPHPGPVLEPDPPYRSPALITYAPSSPSRSSNC
jgi:hypothetical protein